MTSNIDNQDHHWLAQTDLSGVLESSDEEASSRPNLSGHRISQHISSDSDTDLPFVSLANAQVDAGALGEHEIVENYQGDRLLSTIPQTFVDVIGPEDDLLEDLVIVDPGFDLPSEDETSSDSEADEPSPVLPLDADMRPEELLPLVDTVTQSLQSLWSHRLFRKYVQAWFPPDSELALIGKFCQPQELPSVLVPLLCHAMRGPLLQLLNIWVQGRYQWFLEATDACDLKEEQQAELKELARAYWLGGDQVEIGYRLQMSLAELSPEQSRLLYLAGANLFQRNRAMSIERVKENLGLIQDALNIIFRMIKRDLDERARFEIDDHSAVRRLKPGELAIDFEDPGYRPGTLGYKLERLIQKIMVKLRKYMKPELFADLLRQLAGSCQHEQDTDCFIQALLDDREAFTRVAADVAKLILEPLERFVVRISENILCAILAHDGSDFVQEVVRTVHDALRIYFEEKDKLRPFDPNNPLPLLQRLRARRSERWSLHPSVPVTKDAAQIRQADMDYFVHQVIPKVGHLVFPHSNLINELLRALTSTGTEWKQAVGARSTHVYYAELGFEGVDHIMAHIVSERIVDILNTQLKPEVLNDLIIQWVEERWRSSYEVTKDIRKQREMQRVWHEYERRKRAVIGKRPRRLYLRARVAIRMAIDLWVPELFPGVQGLVLSAVLQLHEMMQCTPVVKSILYHSIDSTLDHLMMVPKQPAADLNKPISKLVRSYGAEGPFSEDCLHEMARACLYLFHVGADHPVDARSYAESATVIFAKTLTWLKEGKVIEIIQDRLEDQWNEKWEISFPGILAYLMDQVQMWISDSEEGLDKFLRDAPGVIVIPF